MTAKINISVRMISQQLHPLDEKAGERHTAPIRKSVG